MLILISPAKTLDFESPIPGDSYSLPLFLKESRGLVRDLKQQSPEQLATLMHMSSKLGELNHQRYQHWKTPFTTANARPAIFAFKGDVYLGLKASQMSNEELAFAQSHLRILSGLYGVLRPLDLIQAYRLEMGTPLANSRGDDLYGYWRSMLTRQIAAELKADAPSLLINLASNEYFSVLDTDLLGAPIITPQFLDYSKGKYRFLSYFAKQARGMMAAYIIRHRLQQAEQLVQFNEDGYRYCAVSSTAESPVFLRKQSKTGKKAA